jgi:hypothetical protein
VSEEAELFVMRLEPFCPALFQVRPQRVNQVVDRLGLLIARCGLRIKNVKADVSLDHLGHQSVHGAAASGNVMQHLGAFGLLVERPFDGLDLPPDSSYAVTAQCSQSERSLSTNRSVS